jgi:hypothetical protein
VELVSTRIRSNADPNPGFWGMNIVKFTAEKNIFFDKNCKLLIPKPLGLHEECPSYITWHFFILLYFLGSFALLNPDPDPDPADQNQCGSKVGNFRQKIIICFVLYIISVRVLFNRQVLVYRFLQASSKCGRGQSSRRCTEYFSVSEVTLENGRSHLTRSPLTPWELHIYCTIQSVGLFWPASPHEKLITLTPPSLRLTQHIPCVGISDNVHCTVIDSWHDPCMAAGLTTIHQRRELWWRCQKALQKLFIRDIMSTYTVTKIPFMYSQKRNCVASVPVSCVCERFIYSQDRSKYFPAAE